MFTRIRKKTHNKFIPRNIETVGHQRGEQSERTVIQVTYKGMTIRLTTNLLWRLEERKKQQLQSTEGK